MRPPQTITPRGVSVPELLVVITLLGLAAMVSIPLIASKVHQLKLRSAATQLSTSARATRTIAITTGGLSSLAVEVDPINRYTYTDSNGRLRVVSMPPGVRIDATSDAMLEFRPDGTLAATRNLWLRALLSRGVEECWRIEVRIPGIPRLTRECP